MARSPHPAAIRLLGAAQGFEYGEDFGEAFFPRAFAGEAGGEVGNAGLLFGAGSVDEII